LSYGVQPEGEWPLEEPQEVLEPARTEESQDAVGDYLASIAQFPLLTSAEEVQLGLAVETWLKLKELRQEFENTRGRAPGPAELGGIIYQRMVSHRGLLYALASALGATMDRPSLSALLSRPQVRSTLDDALSPKVKDALMAAIQESVEAVDSNFAALATLSRLLPPFLIQLVEEEGGPEATPLLESHEVVLQDWWQRVKTEGHAAMERPTNSNLRLVVSVARRYLRWGLPIPDLIQEGNLGLMRAVEKFNPHLGYRFSTYATWWIRQSIARGLAGTGRTIRLPAHILERVQKLYLAECELLMQLGRDPTVVELAEELGWPVATVEELRQQRWITVSLETPVGREEEATLADFLPDTSGWFPDEIAVARLTRQEVMQALEELPPRLRRILVLRFGFLDDRPRTLEEVGQGLGVTRERVRRLQKQALEKLKSSRKLAPVPDPRSQSAPAVVQSQGGASMAELLVGEVMHYYSKLGVAALNLRAPLSIGDRVYILGHTTGLEGVVDSIEIDHQRIDLAQPGDDVAIKVVGKVRQGDKVYRKMEDDGSIR
jgi:RNA polymerase primary sigma factor